MALTRWCEVEESSYVGIFEPHVENGVTIVTADVKSDCALRNFMSCETPPWDRDSFMQWLGCLKRKSRQEKVVHATLGTQNPRFSETPRTILFIRLSSFKMSVIWLLLLWVHISVYATVIASSPPTQRRRAAITLTEVTSQTPADLGIDISLYFTNPGSPIPNSEVRQLLSFANDEVQAHLPHDARRPIFDSSFETNITFPRTGDYIYLWVYAYGHGLSWLQLSQALTKLQMYMLGIGPGHPASHYQELEFYVQLGPAIETARGAIEFTPGQGAEAKRALDSGALQLVQANVSSPSNADLPITFNIAVNLDLKVTWLGSPIAEATVLEAIDSAFTDVLLNHEDVEAKIPKNLYPYSFKHISGKRAQLFVTEIVVSPSSGKRGITWSLLCLLYYGLRDFMRATKHFNTTNFELIDTKLGNIASGEVRYSPLVSSAK